MHISRRETGYFDSQGNGPHKRKRYNYCILHLSVPTFDIALRMRAHFALCVFQCFIDSYPSLRGGAGYSLLTRVRLVILFFTNYPLWFSRTSSKKLVLTV